jgi:sialic acid synthase SpsE
MMGSAVVRPTAPELEMRKLARRSLVALTHIAKGEMLTLSNVGVRRPGHGLQPRFLDQVIGAVAARDIPAGDVLLLGDVGK